MKKALFLALLLLGCGQADAPEKPSNLLTEEQMVKAMIETVVLDQQISEARIEKPAAIDTFQKYEKIIFADLGIDSAAYYASYQYYLGRPELFAAIAQAVTDSIGKERDAQAPAKTEGQ